jgi:succinate-semialdehyde dehydrogenase / glutarate-semialdehyde dehydrogenase
MCVSVERVYVEAPVYDDFVERVKQLSTQVKVSPESGFDVTMGSMTHQRELERVERHVQDALDKGARLVAGGKRRPDLGPLFFEPTVLADVNHTMDVMREETFGPVIAIMPVRNEHEAVEMANDSRYGLSGSIFTRDLARGEHLATHLDTGDITVNRTTAVLGSPALEWGGQKESGVGRRGGPEGLLRFTNPQSIVVDRQIGSKPSVNLVDERTKVILLSLRLLRRYLPFV